MKLGVTSAPDEISRLAAVYIPTIGTRMIFYQPPASSSNPNWNPIVYTTTANPENGRLHWLLGEFFSIDADTGGVPK